jgi:hypothetical protein
MIYITYQEIIASFMAGMAVVYLSLILRESLDL